MDVHQILEATAKKFAPKLPNSNNITVRRSVASKFPSENLPGSSPGVRNSSKIRPPLLSNSVIGNTFDEGDLKIDSEIESIQKEIGRLTLRLEYLRLEKLKRISSKSAAALKRGRFVQAKFKEPMPRKATSLGPAEIHSATKQKKPGNRQEFTPVSRRKSCFYKIEEVDELKSSPKPGKAASKSVSFIEAKELFKEGEKSVTVKKPQRSGRPVSSRYLSSCDASATNGSRKRSLLDGDSQTNKKRISTKPEAFQ